MLSDDIKKKLIKKKDYSVDTIKKLDTVIRWCYKNGLEIDPPNKFNKKDFLGMVDTFIDNLNRYPNRCVVKTNLNYFINCCSCVCKGKKEIDSLNRLQEYFNNSVVYSSDVERLDRSKTEEILELDFYPLIKAFKEDALKENNYLSWNRYILCILMSHMPLRLNEFNNLMWVDNKNNNFVDALNNRLIIRIHKNQKFKNIKKIEYPSNIIDELLEWKKLNDSDYVFIDKSKKKLSTDNFNRLLKQIFPQGIGIHKIRKFQTTKKFNDLGITKEQITNIIKLMDGMGHSITTSSIDYMRKFENNK